MERGSASEWTNLKAPTMNDTFAQFDLSQEMRDAVSRKPWRAGLYSKTLVRIDDLRVQ